MTSEIIDNVSDVVVAISAAATAIIAFWGVNSWKNELAGKRKFEVATSLLTAAYNFEQNIKFVRSRFIPAYEFPEKHDPMDGSADKQASAYQFIYSNRWKTIASDIPNWNLLEAEAKAVISDDEVDLAIKEFNVLLRDLQAAIGAFVEDQASGGEDFKQNKEYGDKVKSTLLDGGEEGVFERRIGSALVRLKEALAEYLGR